jgi:hypothetical protein
MSALAIAHTPRVYYLTAALPIVLRARCRWRGRMQGGFISGVLGHTPERIQCRVYRLTIISFTIITNFRVGRRILRANFT